MMNQGKQECHNLRIRSFRIAWSPMRVRVEKLSALSQALKIFNDLDLIGVKLNISGNGKYVKSRLVSKYGTSFLLINVCIKIT